MTLLGCWQRHTEPWGLVAGKTGPQSMLLRLCPRLLSQAGAPNVQLLRVLTAKGPQILPSRQKGHKAKASGLSSSLCTHMAAHSQWPADTRAQLLAPWLQGESNSHPPEAPVGSGCHRPPHPALSCLPDFLLRTLLSESFVQESLSQAPFL